MKITSCIIYQYTLPLIKPIVVKGTHIHQRKGLLLQLQADGHVGYGEIAPLESFSKETLEEARNQIVNIQGFLLNESIPVGIEELDGQCDEWLGGLKLLPSVRFGVEMAALQLKASKLEVPLAKLLSPTTHEMIPINGLLNGDKESVAEQAKVHILEGYKGLKLKVGQGSIEDDIEKVKAVSEIVREKALLHLDANQQWSVEDAIRFGEEVGPAAVDYIEEPFADLERLHEFFDKTLIPVALDESIIKLSFDEIKSLDPVDILVLKPSLLGGIERVWKMIKDAKSFGIETLISSIYESSVGIHTLMNIAGCSFRNNAAGLDTLRYFKEDVLKKPLVIDRGQYLLNGRVLDHEALNHKRLEVIAP